MNEWRGSLKSSHISEEFVIKQYGVIHKHVCTIHVSLYSDLCPDSVDNVNLSWKCE